MEINKKKLVVGLIFFALLATYALLAIYITYYAPRTDSAPSGTATSVADSTADPQRQALLQLAEELMAKRRKLGAAAYEFTITEYGQNLSGVQLMKTLWDDYHNYGQILAADSFLGVDKGLLYEKQAGKVEFRGSVSADQGALLATAGFRDYIFDNLLWEVKNHPENSSLAGEEIFNNQKCYVFENKIFPGGATTEVVRKFWISAEDGTLLHEEVENKFSNENGEAATEVLLVEMRKPPVFSADKPLIAPVTAAPADLPDTDQDGLVDEAEENIFRTDAQNPDTDGDGHLDGAEVDAGYDPAVPSPDDKLLG